MTTLAQILKVDEAWLSVGKSPELSEKQQQARNASADGAVNVLAGFVQMNGGHPAFPHQDDARASTQKIDLYAIIRGAQYAFHVITAEKTKDAWKFVVPVEAREAVVLGVLPVGDVQVEFLELDWEQIESLGSRKGPMFEVVIPFDDMGTWKRIRSFAERL